MSFLAKGQERLQGEIDRALAIFREAGAEFVDVPTLLPADVMLDIYGEDIRNQAFLVHDGVEGNFVLRPDFTVPVVEAHLESGKTRARYAYSGRVWRKRRKVGATRRHSFWQVGIEFFDKNARAENDAEVFALSARTAAPFGLSMRTGDLGLVFSLLEQIEMKPWRRDALMRQFWRPNAFEKLLARFTEKGGKHKDLPLSLDVPVTGKRSEAMILARIMRLKEDAAEPPLAHQDVDLLRKVLAVQGSLASAEADLGKLASAAPALEVALAGFSARNQALQNAGIDIGAVPFDASFGRETMEYYDGFVFSFDEGPVSILAGGRYDRLAQSFGNDSGLSAVGVAYRPELMEALA